MLIFQFNSPYCYFFFFFYQIFTPLFKLIMFKWIAANIANASYLMKPFCTDGACEKIIFICGYELACSQKYWMVENKSLIVIKLLFFRYIHEMHSIYSEFSLHFSKSYDWTLTQLYKNVLSSLIKDLTKINIPNGRQYG